MPATGTIARYDQSRFGNDRVDMETHAFRILDCILQRAVRVRTALCVHQGSHPWTSTIFYHKGSILVQPPICPNDLGRLCSSESPKGRLPLDFYRSASRVVSGDVKIRGSHEEHGLF